MDALSKRLARGLQQIIDLPDAPTRTDASMLDLLFEDLAREDPVRLPHEIEDDIWALWGSHADQEARARMEDAIHALASRDFTESEPMLGALVADYPDWAEAWNKRATAYFIDHKDYESLGDIFTVLKLEPRHFGAICGFGHIALRNDEPASALTAFEKALSINPHMGAIRHQVASLAPMVRLKLH